MAGRSNERQSKPPDQAEEKLECFVVMPISDPDGYVSGHFQHVFEDIFRPACEAAGYCAVRADQVRETNLIHLDVLQRLLKTPMVLADLSSRNPNVLFELGLRQAFDMPAVLVQEVGTPKIFDIAPLRYTEYRRARVYHEVLEDQQAIAESIKATRDAYAKGAGVNSIVRILSLTQPASLPDLQEAGRDPVLQLIRAELNELRLEIRRSQRQRPPRLLGSERATSREDLERLAFMTRELESDLTLMRNQQEIDLEIGERIIDHRRRVEDAVRYSARHPDTVIPNFISDVYQRLSRLEQDYQQIIEKRMADLLPETNGG